MKKTLYFSRYLTAFWLIAAFATGTLIQGQAAAPGRALSAAETELAEKITISSIKEMTAALASPEMEGRGTGQPGGDRAAAWIADKFKSYGLKPLGDKGSYLQKVEFKETTATQDTSFLVGDQMLVYAVDYVLLPPNH